MYWSRLTIVSREAKKSQRPLSEIFTGNTAKKLANALAKPPWQLSPSYYSPNTFLLLYIESTNQQWWKSAPPFSSTGHFEFNGARLCTHDWKTIPIPLVLKFNTFIVPSINIESISPTMKHCRLSSFSISLSHSHLSPWSPWQVWSARRFFIFLSFNFHRTLFSRAQKFAWAPRIQILRKIYIKLKYSI